MDNPVIVHRNTTIQGLIPVHKVVFANNGLQIIKLRSAKMTTLVLEGLRCSPDNCKFPDVVAERRETGRREVEVIVGESTDGKGIPFSSSQARIGENARRVPHGLAHERERRCSLRVDVAFEERPDTPPNLEHGGLPC